MHPITFLPLLLLSSLTSTFAAKKSTKAKDAVLLSNVRSLTLQSGKLTTGRRSKPVPQLKCVGGSAKGRHEVDVMQCKNSGSEYDAEDIQWTCQASLPPEFKLGSTEVVCEGYDSPEDPFVLKGSCGVEYRLILTEVGEEKYGGGAWGRSKYNFGGEKVAAGGTGVVDLLWKVLFWGVFITIIVIFIYKIFGADPRRGLNLPNRPPGGGFWGGGGGGDDDPPPPYTPRGPPRSSKPRSSYNPSSSASSGPGFWSGAGLGGAAGYAAGNYMGRRQQNNMYAAPGPSNYGGGGNSWFGGGGGAGPSTYGGGAGPSSSAPSSSRYESTGFGGTRRR